MVAVVVDASVIVPALVQPELAIDAAEHFREHLVLEQRDALFLIALDGRVAPYASPRADPPALREIRDRFNTARRAGWAPCAVARHAVRHRLRRESADVWWVGAPLTAQERRGWAREGHDLREFTPQWGRGVQWGILFREIAAAEVVR